MKIQQPRGMPNLANLSVKKGEIFIVGDQMDSMVVELYAFDFSFLPGFTMENTEVIVTFDKDVKAEV